MTGGQYGVCADSGGAVEVGGNVEGANTGVSAGYGSTVAVKGDVSSENGDGVATYDAGVTVEVSGDVKGEGGVGIDITGARISDESEENQEPPQQTKIVVKGTVSGKDGAVVDNKSKAETYVSGDATDSSALDFDTENIDLTVWKAEGEDAIRVVNSTIKGVWNGDNYTEDITVETDKDATETFLKRVNYIIRKADIFDPKIMVSGDHTVTLDANTYFTAHEGEDVKVDLNLDDTHQVLVGIYYNNDDEASLTKVDELKKDAAGSFLIAMRRFGGMLLGLKIHIHTPGAAVQENTISATCAKEGSYDEVVYCSECGDEMSRKSVTTDKLSHIPGTPKRENVIEAKPGVKGHYDEVVYCTLCGAELSARSIEIPALADDQPVEHTDSEQIDPEKIDPEKTDPEKTDPEKTDPEKTDPEQTDPEKIDPEKQTKPARSVVEPAKETAATRPATRTEFVYEPVDKNTEMHGVKAADHQVMADVISIVAAKLVEDELNVDIVDKEKLLNAEELVRFNSLGAKDRLMVILVALRLDGVDGMTDMSVEASALSADIAERLDKLTENEEQERMNLLQNSFLHREITINDQKYEAVSIELIITGNGTETRERFTFYKDGDAWTLFQIEKGEYRTAGL